MLQVVTLCLIAAYLMQAAVYYHRRNNQGWDAISSQISSDRTAWALFKNARVMMEAADYAEHNGHVDSKMLSSLRKDAMAIRISILSYNPRLRISDQEDEPGQE